MQQDTRAGFPIHSHITSDYFPINNIIFATENSKAQIPSRICKSIFCFSRFKKIIDAA